MQSRSISGRTDEGLSTYPEIFCLLYSYGDGLEDKNERKPHTYLTTTCVQFFFSKLFSEEDPSTCKIRNYYATQIWLPVVIIFITCRLIHCKWSLLTLLVCGDDINYRKILFSVSTRSQLPRASIRIVPLSQPCLVSFFIFRTVMSAGVL